MEISAVSVSKAVSSSWYSSFSDQSHLQFYGHRRSSFLTPCKLRFKVPSCRPSASNPVMAAGQLLCNSPCVADTELTAEEALMKELADLKLQMKQKKKELKAHIKEDKKKLKTQMKEDKKRKKQKDAQEGKGKVKCQSLSSSSSSSSESCDEECSSVSMKILRQTQFTHEDARENGEGRPVLENCVAISAVSASSVCSALSMNDTVEDCEASFSTLSSSATETCLENPSMVFSDKDSLTVASIYSFNGCTSRANVTSELESVQKHAFKNGDTPLCQNRVNGQLSVTPRVPPSLHMSNRIEVCAGGKCKKAGSEKLLLALQGQIPRSANVEAVSCKCMGKCSMGMNVRVLKEDTNPQHHSHVGVEDGSLILSHHFGLGCPSVGLPILSPTVPLPLVIA